MGAKAGGEVFNADKTVLLVLSGNRIRFVPSSDNSYMGTLGA